MVSLINAYLVNPGINIYAAVALFPSIYSIRNSSFCVSEDYKRLAVNVNLS